MKNVKLKIGKAAIDVEMADTFFDRMRGLMFRSSLGEGKGMLFVFDKEDYWPIWMMGMRFPIDIIWVGKNMRVVDIIKNARPRLSFKTHTPKRKAKYVLEFNAGFVKSRKIKIGSKIEVKGI